MTYRTQLAEVDLGNLLFEDKAPLDFDSKGEVTDKVLYDIGLECTAHFFKLLWELPTETVDSVTVSLLPKPTFRLPREKKIPSRRDFTRWERFAQLKGIHNKKKSRKVWDETTKSWRPRWGKDRINDLKDNWVLEVPDNADPYEDQFAKMAKAKKERRAKNEFQRLRNIARSVKPGQAPPIGVLSESQGSKNELTRALSIAKKSDASMGRFSAPLDERKISKKLEQKVKPRLKLSEVVRERMDKATKRKSEKPKPKSKLKPKLHKKLAKKMKSKGQSGK